MRTIVAMRSLVLGAALCACASPSPPTIGPIDDAGVDGGGWDGPKFSCWPPIPQVAGATATLGAQAVDGSFMEVPEVYPLDYGIQAGFMFMAYARMDGISVGNPADILDPSNPFTRIRAYFDDTDIPLNQSAVCGARFAYTAMPAGGYQLPFAIQVPFDTCWRYNNLLGKRIRIELEVMDSQGNYASETRVVLGGEPYPSTTYPAETDAPGCIQ